MKRLISALCACLASAGAAAQTAAPDTAPAVTEIAPLEGERWWGGLVALGNAMPFASDTPEYDMARNNMNNQTVPLMLSSRGRYVWSERPFAFRLHGDTLRIVSEAGPVEAVAAGETLRDAYMAASAAHFPPSGRIPEEIFFSKPQYNTWIELMYDQNQADILEYAEKAVENGFPTGIFMIDDNWQKYYGNFDFKPDKFPDARAMTDRLHADGFDVMVWVCPFVSPDSPEYRFLASKGYLVKDRSGAPAIIRWWNGASACYDVTNPEAADYLAEQLRETQRRYGVDGFKFDAGDVAYMGHGCVYREEGADASTFAQRWAEMGLRFPFNELRSCFKLGGRELVQRLGDKNYSWNAVRLLIPDMTAAGLLGYAYTCPDMIGGGQFSSFLDVDPDNFDQELIVRSCQIHAMMPMMQFSVAPWRILDERHMRICARYAQLHERMGGYILELAQHAADTGEPIVRPMEYAFPHEGFAECADQFMLGDEYMVAPMTAKGTSREVRLPRGVWVDDEGNRFRGPKVLEIDVPIERLPYFRRVK